MGGLTGFTGLAISDPIETEMRIKRRKSISDNTDTNDDNLVVKKRQSKINALIAHLGISPCWDMSHIAFSVSRGEIHQH